MECFYEQFQTKDYGRIKSILNNVSKIILAFVIISAASFQWIAVAIFVALYAILIGLIKTILLEYEYELTNEELVIYKIVNEKNRKTIGTINVTQIIEVKDIKRVNKNNMKIVTAYLKGIDLNDTVIVTRTSKGLLGFHIAMDEKLVQLVRRQNQGAFRNI